MVNLCPPPCQSDFLLSPRGEVETGHTFPPDIPEPTHEARAENFRGFTPFLQHRTNKKEVPQLTSRDAQTWTSVSSCQENTKRLSEAELGSNKSLSKPQILFLFKQFHLPLFQKTTFLFVFCSAFIILLLKAPPLPSLNQIYMKTKKSYMPKIYTVIQNRRRDLRKQAKFPYEQTITAEDQLFLNVVDRNSQKTFLQPW